MDGVGTAGVGSPPHWLVGLQTSLPPPSADPVLMDVAWPLPCQMDVTVPTAWALSSSQILPSVSLGVGCHWLARASCATVSIFSHFWVQWLQMRHLKLATMGVFTQRKSTVLRTRTI